MLIGGESKFLTHKEFSLLDKQLLLGIDVADQFRIGFENGYLYDESRMRQLVRRCADMGFDTLYWRVSATGQVTYRSKVRTVIGAKGKIHSGFRPNSVENLILKQCDPPVVAVDEAHKCGMKIFAYVTLFDEYYEGMESDFEIANPQFTWKHLSKDHHIRGLLSYAYPEVREHRLAELEELLAYGFDGVYLDTARSHCGVQPVLAVPLQSGSPFLLYGYNDIEVEAFREETGKDAMWVDRSQDEYLPVHFEEYHRFRGRYLTQFLREARALTRRSEAELSVGFYPDSGGFLSPEGQHGRFVMGRFHHDWQAWVEEDLVDAIVLVAEHRRFGAKDWKENSEAKFQQARDKGKKVYLWAATEYMIDQMEDAPGPLPLNITEDRELFLRGLERGIHQCMSTTADGVYLYEAMAPDDYDYWADIKRILNTSPIHA